MGNTNITAGGITAIVAESLANRRIEGPEATVASRIEAVTANAIEDRSTLTQDLKNIKLDAGQSSEVKIDDLQGKIKPPGKEWLNDLLQDPTKTSTANQELLAQVFQKQQAALKGEVDTTPIKGNNSPRTTKDLLKEAGIKNPSDHNAKVYETAIRQGASPEQAVAKVKRDPLVFDLNGDGDTNATVDQRGIEVDGATATKWAEKGDGVLAMGSNPIDTVDSRGYKHKDAFATLKSEARFAGIDVSKGYLDTKDLKLLEAKGLTMMVSNGDGTNQLAKPTELGITRIPLSGTAVDKTDIAGNSIASEASFVRNGKEQLLNDMLFNEI